MVSLEKGLPTEFDPGQLKKGTDQVDMKTAKNVRWVAKLGSQTYGNPTVSNGLVLVGTNNAAERRPGIKGDYSLIQAFGEKDGAFKWQLSVPKLGAGKVNDWEFLGICSSPAIEEDRVYVLTNRCEVVCLDLAGMSNGNQGPYKDEGAYMAGQGKAPIQVEKTDADIIWRYDMREDLGVFPHNVTSSSILIVGDRLFATTSNGADWSHLNIPAPFSPSLVALDKKSGTLIGEEAVGISERTLHSNWSSPLFVPPGKKKGDEGLVVFGGGDGFLYGFEPAPVVDKEGLRVLKERWRFDANKPTYREKDGKKIQYATAPGASEIIATPVYHDGKVYTLIGQDPEHGTGVGRLSCVDPNGKGDITQSGAIWTYDGINRSISTVAVADGLIYAADYDGKLHCLDANTGELKWVHDTMAHIWGSPLVADGRVYIGNEDGELTILAASAEKKVIRVVPFPAPIYSSPIVANGVLYVATQTHLYAIGSPAK